MMRCIVIATRALRASTTRALSNTTAAAGGGRRRTAGAFAAVRAAPSPLLPLAVLPALALFGAVAVDAEAEEATSGAAAKTATTKKKKKMADPAPALPKKEEEEPPAKPKPDDPPAPATTTPAPTANPEEKKKQAVIQKIKADKIAALRKPPPTVDPEKVLYAGNRVIFVTGSVDIKMARAVVAQLLYLDSQSDEPIQMIINSGGGVVADGLAIYDTMKAIRAPVHTCVVGRAMSMAAVLCAAGEPGHRVAMPHAQIMIHEISSAHGRSKITDLRIRMQNSEAINEVLIACLADDTAKDKPTLRKLMQRDHYMTANEAVGFNLVDYIVRDFGVSKTNKQTQHEGSNKTPAGSSNTAKL